MILCVRFLGDGWGVGAWKRDTTRIEGQAECNGYY